MKIVIDMPKVVYEAICNYKNPLCCKEDIEMTDAIHNGTPLPEGHGRLIDADKFVSEHFGKVARLVDDAPTIIEADKEGAEDAEEMDKDEKTNSIKMLRSASMSLSKALDAIRPIIMGTNLYFRHKGYESTLRYALDDIEGILEELEGGNKEE